MLVIISFILMTSMFDTGLILLLQGKIRSQSLSGVMGPTDV